MAEFDIKKARAFESCQEYEHCKAGEIIEAACNEIERLRAENAAQEQGINNLQTALVMRDQRIAEQAKHIQALESDLKYAQEGCQHGRREHARLAAILGESDVLYVLAQHVMDRNAKLEAALIEERCRSLYCMDQFAGILQVNDIRIDGAICRNESDEKILSTRFRWDFPDNLGEEAEEQLRAEGLIDSIGQHVEPTKLMLTAEQRESLSRQLGVLEGAISTIGNVPEISAQVAVWKKDASILRAMLTETKP